MRRNFGSKFSGFFGAGFLAASVVLAAGGASAQTQAPEQESERAFDRAGSIESQLRASEIAVTTLSNPNCPVVSYADILAAPDDIELNVCYALQKIDSGDVRGASATLERILLIAPQALNVRYLYAIVLYRLDSNDEAEREFRTVLEGDLSPAVREQVEDYLDAIDRRRKTVKQTATVGIGAYYATNRNSAPDSERQLAAGVGTPIALEDNRPNQDIGYLTILGYDFSYDPGFQNQHEFFGGIDLFADTLSEQNELDVQAMDLDLGMRLRFPGYTITPRVFLRNMRLEWAKFYQSEGAELRIDHKHKIKGANAEDWPLLDTWASVSAQDEDYHNTPNYPTLTLRSGPKYNVAGGVGMRVVPEHYIAFKTGAEFKSASPDGTNNAGARVFSYKYYNAELSHTWLLGDGQFLLSSVMMGWRDYKEADALVVGANGKVRYEQPNRARLTYGVPLTEVIGDDWLQRTVNSNDTIQDFFNGSTLALTGEYFYQRSNITNYQYSSRRVQVLLTRKLDF